MSTSDSPRARDDRPSGSGARRVLRVVALVLWAALLGAFWFGARQAGVGPIEYLRVGLDGLTGRTWAPVALMGLYLLRPLLLLPITFLNLTSGYLLGPVQGVPVAMAGTLLSATVGYAIGRTMGSARLAGELTERWGPVRMLRGRSFEAVVAGGLMYLHADLVNLPAGLLRIRFPIFLLGIAVGNALTLTTAVLTGASVEGSLVTATIRFEPRYLALGAALFLVSLTLAYLLRKRVRPMG